MSDSVPETTLGQAAYEAYRLASAGNSLVGEQSLPEWDDQAPEIRAAWSAAAVAVAALCDAGNASRLPAPSTVTVTTQHPFERHRYRADALAYEHGFVVILSEGEMVGRYAPGTIAQVVVDGHLIAAEHLGGSWPGPEASSSPRSCPPPKVTDHQRKPGQAS
jgi:hypothetical protein